MNAEGLIITETHQKAQGVSTAECQAISSVRSSSRGATAYLNMEPSHPSSLDALITGGVSRVVIGLENPLPHIHGRYIQVNLVFMKSLNSCIGASLARGCSGCLRIQSLFHF